MVVHACLKGVVKQLGRGPPSLQMLDSISSLTESSKPRGCVACREKYLGQGMETQKGFANLCRCSGPTCPSDTAHTWSPLTTGETPLSQKQFWEPCPETQMKIREWETGMEQETPRTLKQHWLHCSHACKPSLRMGEWPMNLRVKCLLPLQLLFPPWVITQAVVESHT